jgi:hypothetical protein
MAVPNDSFSLEDVLVELGGVSAFIVPSLYWAFDAADEDGFVGSGRDSLLDFAGYETPEEEPPPPTTYQYSLGFASDGAGACTATPSDQYWGDNITFGDATLLWTNSGGTVLASAGYYSQGQIAGYRYWDGSTFGSAGTTQCPGGDPPPGGGLGG